MAGLRDKDRRNRERLTHDVEDTENRLRQTDNRLRDSDNRLRETEDRLNDSQRENDRLHDKLQGNVRFIDFLIKVDGHGILSKAAHFRLSVKPST